MNKTAQLRLLGTCLALGRFTVAELSDQTGVGLDTTYSWLRRHKEWFATDDGQQPSRETAANGRPRLHRYLRPEAEPILRAELAEAWQAVAPAMEGAGNANVASDVTDEDYFASVHTAERKLDASDAARAEGMGPLARQNHHSALTWIRLAWQDLDELAENGGSVPLPILVRLANLEQRASQSGQTVAFASLAQARTHLVTQMKEAVAAGRSVLYSGAVIYARAEAGGHYTSALLFGAALATIAEGADNETLAEAVIRAVPNEESVIQHVSALADRVRSPGDLDPDDFIAVVNGLAVDRMLKASTRVAQWVFALRPTDAWQPQLAPAAFCLMAETPNTELEKLKDVLASDLNHVLGQGKAFAPSSPPVASIWSFVRRVFTLVNPINRENPVAYWGGRAAA